ncbi:K(+) efflux antiporter 2 [Durusdinium trenchii]|uniref:Chloroplastic n=1 Tax=Durusdinium trenchii TaxID=1381693 RepID=A0ABP0P033_9DINO
MAATLRRYAPLAVGGASLGLGGLLAATELRRELPEPCQVLQVHLMDPSVALLQSDLATVGALSRALTPKRQPVNEEMLHLKWSSSFGGPKSLQGQKAAVAGRFRAGVGVAHSGQRDLRLDPWSREACGAVACLGGCPIGADVMVVVMVVSYQEKWDKWVFHRAANFTCVRMMLSFAAGEGKAGVMGLLLLFATTLAVPLMARLRTSWVTPLVTLSSLGVEFLARLDWTGTSRKAVVKKDVCHRTIESIHGTNACYEWPRHQIGFKRSQEGAGEGLVPDARPRNLTGPHFSETTSHGLIIGTQPKFLPTGPRRTPPKEAVTGTPGRKPSSASHEKAGSMEVRLQRPSGSGDIWDDREWGEYQK